MSIFLVDNLDVDKNAVQFKVKHFHSSASSHCLHVGKKSFLIQ
jgi:hypothetical protein